MGPILKKLRQALLAPWVLLCLGLAACSSPAMFDSESDNGPVPVETPATQPEELELEGTVPGEVDGETTEEMDSDESQDTGPAMNEQGFVELTDVVPDAMLEMRYFGTYNFVGDRIDGYEEPVALVTREAAEALKGVSDDLEGQGYRLLIYDAYRPQTAVNDFIEWSQDPNATEMKEYFYPNEPKETLFENGYIARRSGHSRGSTLDLTLFDMERGEPVDMGGTFDYFGEKSHPGNTAGLTDEQIANRRILADAMQAHGFEPISTEWWHFTLADEPYPDTYFDFPVASID